MLDVPHIFFHHAALTFQCSSVLGSIPNKTSQTKKGTALESPGSLSLCSFRLEKRPEEWQNRMLQPEAQGPQVAQIPL